MKKNEKNITSTSVNPSVSNVAPVKTVAELMAETSIKFTSPTAVSVVTSDIVDYIGLYSAELRTRARQLGKGCGGRLLDETIAAFTSVTGKGVTKGDLKAILIASECGRTDANGYAATFAASETAERASGCPSRVMRYKKDGLYCVRAS